MFLKLLVTDNEIFQKKTYARKVLVFLKSLKTEIWTLYFQKYLIILIRSTFIESNHF